MNQDKSLSSSMIRRRGQTAAPASTRVAANTPEFGGYADRDKVEELRMIAREEFNPRRLRVPDPKEQLEPWQTRGVLR